MGVIRPKARFKVWLRSSAAAVGLGLLLAVCTMTAGEKANAQTARQPGYFIEFRARPSPYVGHTYVVYGRLDASGRPVERHQAGFFPGDDYLTALIIPVRGTVGRDSDDALASTAVYRRRITAIEYRRVVDKVRLLRATQRSWHFFFFNCNDFAIEIAETLNLHRLPSLVPPNLWVDSLRLLSRD